MTDLYPCVTVRIVVRPDDGSIFSVSVDSGGADMSLEDEAKLLRAAASMMED